MNSASPLELLGRLVGVEGLTGAEQRAIDAATALCRELGLSPEATPDGVIVRAGPADAPTLCFCSHLDTVPAGDGWETPPHEATIRDGTLYGRGAIDARASCLAIMLTVAHFHRSSPARGAVLGLLAIGEEGNDPSTPRLLRRISSPAAAVVGEPTAMNIAFAQRGLLELEVAASGVQGHASRVKGRNAVYMLAQDLAALQQLSFDRVHPALGSVRVTPTRLHAGIADNIAPPTATVTLDVRTTPAYTNREIVKLIDGAVSGRVRVVTDLWAPCETSPDHPLVLDAKAALPGAAVYASDAASDWAFFAREGIPTIKVGPGDPKWSHAANERITAAELQAGIDGFVRLAAAWLRREE